MKTTKGIFGLGLILLPPAAWVVLDVLQGYIFDPVLLLSGATVFLSGIYLVYSNLPEGN